MDKEEIIKLLRKYITSHNNGWVIGIDTLLDIIEDIENGYSYEEIVSHYNIY